MSRSRLSRWCTAGALLIGISLITNALLLGQDAITRKIKSQVAPAYPDLARRMSITGVVKIQVRVDKNGIVKDTKVIGGHPVLANAAMDAVKRWKYEPASDETTGIVEFRLAPTQ